MKPHGSLGIAVTIESRSRYQPRRPVGEVVNSTQFSTHETIEERIKDDGKSRLEHTARHSRESSLRFTFATLSKQLTRRRMQMTSSLKYSESMVISKQAA